MDTFHIINTVVLVASLLGVALTIYRYMVDSRHETDREIERMLLQSRDRINAACPPDEMPVAYYEKQLTELQARMKKHDAAWFQRRIWGGNGRSDN